MQQNQVFVKGIAGTFPSSMAYNLIFLTAAIVSIVSIALVMITKNMMSQIEEKTQVYSRYYIYSNVMGKHLFHSILSNC
jgi:hypothetical protein